MSPWRSRFKPAVSRRALLALAGAMWICAGLMLLVLAIGWLRAAPEAPVAWLVAGGSMGALLIHHFGFLRIVDRNLGRIRAMEGKRCAFSFMPLKSYAMVAVMMAMGIGLRHSPLPKPYLAALYIAIGAALVLSSVRYLRVLLTSRDHDLGR